ncbi:hypothetical protein BDY19DRAFT_775612 [Irpex rosettiformis]|uniref:Uncharacterized protein n=1 Tax=Irpex rosettiformis TaxID=378272 RepID=A0ACB8TMD7_9APHY|nr:hypothetical protein BDY19DRAFT_775612 [Irpex rosettiformis]
MVHSLHPVSPTTSLLVCVCIPRSLTFYPLFILYYSLTLLLIASTVPLPDSHPRVAPPLSYTFTLSFVRVSLDPVSDFLCYLFIDYLTFSALPFVRPSVLSRQLKQSNG